MSKYKRHIFQFIATFIYNPHVANLVSGKIYRGMTKSVCVPGINCYSCPAAMGACPVGSFQSFLAGFAPKFPAYVIGLTALFGLALGRMICGWGCPFGALQEIIYKIPSPKIGKSGMTFKLSKMKYVIALLFVIVLPLIFWKATGIGVTTFCKFICPAGTVEGAVPLFIANEKLRAAAGYITAWKFFLLALIMLAMVFVFRPFCRFFCPLGAFYGLFNKYSYFGIKIDSHKCVSCGQCKRVCKMDIKIAGDGECVSCGECLGSCPTGAIYYKSRRKNDEKNYEKNDCRGDGHGGLDAFSDCSEL